jgi:CubicO group peptidase (beta-lactamase class C family)
MSGVTVLLQSSPSAWPAPTGAQSERVNESTDLKVVAVQVGPILERHIASGYMPGAVALIGRGEHAEVVEIGRMAKENAPHMRRDSIFRIASMTKPVTAVATMMLIEKGRLRLDEPIERWLPELGHRRVLKRLDGPLDDTVPAKRPITIEDLLTFRCGLGIIWPAADSYPILRQIAALNLIGFGPPEPAYALAPDEWLKRLGTLPLMAQPGERWLYNTGSYILGALLARASGRSLPDLLRIGIFEPLGMNDTGFFVPERARNRLVSAYRLEAGVAELYDAPATSLWNAAPAFPDGGAGLVSTVDDYFAFAHLLWARGRAGGRRLLSEASIAALTTDHLSVSQRVGGASILGSGRGWGYGLSVIAARTEEGFAPGSYGWNGGLGTSWMADPASGLNAILLTQTGFTSPVAPTVHQEFLRAVLAPAFL